MPKHLFTKIIILVVILGLGASSSQAWGQRSQEIDAEVKVLNSEIQENKESLESLEEREKEIQEKINNTKDKKTSLENELAILENQIAKTQLDIDRVKAEIEEMNLEIRKLILKIENKTEEIRTEKDHIGNLLRMLNKRGKVSSLEILLVNDNLNEFLDEVKYLENTNEKISNSVEHLKRYKEKLQQTKDKKTKKAEQLKEKKQELQDKKEKLEYQKESKNHLLQETKEQTQKFRSLLNEAKQQQQQIENEIINLEKEVRSKLNQQEKEKLDFNDEDFIWPVPEGYITATFHDPDYPFRRIIGEHPAIDIRAEHGTALKAAASGYVAKVKFDGTSNYAYIMLIHGDGYSTVYGHVSQVNVQVDDYVTQGQIIGRTGGMPGTPGSGRFSTGPHLHFEIREDGIPVDPEKYLP